MNDTLATLHEDFLKLPYEDSNVEDRTARNALLAKIDAERESIAARIITQHNRELRNTNRIVVQDAIDEQFVLLDILVASFATDNFGAEHAMNSAHKLIERLS
ncbi:hypothetical protein UFOVP1305_12 [uncultured Caudovirales phage]|uniref:Uncharacterized protein n=1 Tax=uncultured Caudovirales phage TaxID=2100421 RepID=A0A6J5RYY0_9CAUD|nr:hypothetical protein UFOVP896_50 [uncultured Caudovirales phage]CAB4197404.1 hypothetical protein UFOVP1305_12 [uncultured Caudovirales phage]